MRLTIFGVSEHIKVSGWWHTWAGHGSATHFHPCLVLNALLPSVSSFIISFKTGVPSSRTMASAWPVRKRPTSRRRVVGETKIIPPLPSPLCGKIVFQKQVSDAKNLGTTALKYISDHKKSSFLSSVNYSSEL